MIWHNLYRIKLLVKMETYHAVYQACTSDVPRVLVIKMPYHMAHMSGQNEIRGQLLRIVYWLK